MLAIQQRIYRVFHRELSYKSISRVDQLDMCLNNKTQMLHRSMGREVIHLLINQRSKDQHHIFYCKIKNGNFACGM